MLRRRPALGVLILVGLALCLSLSAALARSAQPALLTATPSPLPELAAYLPLIMRAGQPAATATAPTAPSATSSATTSATATTSTITPSTTTTATVATNTAAPTETATTTTTGTPTTTATSTIATETATATGTPTTTATSTIATETATTTGTPTTTATGTTTETATATTTGTATTTATGTATATATGTTTETATATATGTATATATGTATTTATGTATATATATNTAPPVNGNCVAYVFPIALNALALSDNQPYWYKPVPLSDPYEDNGQIPSLNTANPDSPRFRVYSSYNNGGQFLWARWNGNQSDGSNDQLNDALAGAGTLGQGFSEFPPPQNDPAAIPLVNGTLEAGDWLAGSRAVLDIDGANALDAHVANKTLMILPVYDTFIGNGNWPDSGYHIVRFVQVRLLSWNLVGPSKYFEFALVQDNKNCFTTVQLSEKLEWYAPGEPLYNYDIVLVQDYTYSMRYCWDTNAICAAGTRRIDYAAANLREFVNEMLVVRNQQQGADHRLAYVTFNQVATRRIDFNNDTTAALAAFKNAIGDLSTPRTIPNTELDRNTNTTAGLVGAVSYLNNARKVDKNGKPVKLVVVLMVDGLTNVMNDGPGTNVTNGFQNAPYYCGKNASDLDSPLVQYNCPNPANYPGQTVSQPPLKAMVKAANDARSAKAIEFYALVVGNQFGLTPIDMQLDEVAPGRAYMANSPAQLGDLMDVVVSEITMPDCQEFSATRNAAGAQVSVRNNAGFMVAQGNTNAQGEIRFNLPSNSGPYTVWAMHNDVIAPADPLQIQRDYGTAWTIPLIDPVQSSHTGTLTNVDPSNAWCR